MTFDEYIENWASYYFLEDWGKRLEIAQNKRKKHQTNTINQRCIFCGVSAIELAFNSQDKKACSKFIGLNSSEAEEALSKELFAWIES